MLLTIDIGNTNITIGAFKEDELMFVARLSTDRSKTADQYAVDFYNIIKLYSVLPEDFEGAAVSCVVPEVSQSICNAVARIIKKSPLVLSPGVKTGVNILIDDPAQVGADLVAAAIAAANLYPLPCLIVDLGTATKISLVDKSGAFRGCTIAPGIRISLEALSSTASQLPAISLNTPRRAIGTNTIDAMQSGIVYGTASMIDGMCDRIENELDSPVASIIATGGLSADIIKNCKREMIHDANLILYGLKILYGKNNF